MLVSAPAVLTRVPEPGGVGRHSWTLPEHTPVIAFSNACSNKQIILQSIQLDTAQSTMCDQSLKSYYFTWVSTQRQSQWYMVSTPFPHAMKLINLSEYHSKWSLLLTFLVIICLVCVLTSSSANTCSTTASQSLHFWSVSWLLRVTAGPEAVPNRRITDI